MKFVLEQSEEFTETVITIQCSGVIDDKLKRIIDRIREYTFSLNGKKNGEIYHVNLEDIYYFESVDEKVFIYLSDDVYECSYKLYEIEQRFKSLSFMRISKSVVINPDKIKSVRPLINGKLEATMLNGEKILINRHYVSDFKAYFGI
ncbi:MAG: LytTR family DNA-binding domain-containing protein [Acutalibacteraceae bacterium]